MNKKAFTLVELIVVITILAVLATVAFISFQGYGVSARDSARLTDLSSIEKVLELYNVENSRYPSPTYPTNITYSGSTAWSQGVFGKTAYTNNTSMSNSPVDPVTSLEYPYSRTADGQEYQIAAILEDTSNVSLLDIKTYAATETAEIYVKGNYNGKYLKVTIGSATYLLGVPSIIASDITSSLLLEDIVTSKSLVYNGYTNLPASFSGSIYDTSPTDGFDFTPNELVLFEGDIDELENSKQERIIFLEKIQANYTGTKIVAETDIQELLEIDSTSTDLADNYVATSLNNSIKTNIPVVYIETSSVTINQSPTANVSFEDNSTKTLDGVTGYYTQNTTGLKWQASDDGNTYKWSLDASYTEPTWNGTTYNYPTGNASDYPVFEYCDTLGGDGASWRLPTKREFFSIMTNTTPIGMTYSTSLPSIDNSIYWTSTAYTYDIRHVWVGYFPGGMIMNASKTGALPAICIHE